MHAEVPETLSQQVTDTADTQAKMRRIAAAGFTGTLIEFYDLNIYSTAAAIVFAHIFFPQLGKAAGTIAAFGTIGVAFVARPLGSLLFGHFGDRLGRKKTLVTCLSLMGVATVLVGLLPTGEQIGVMAPILLIVLRFLQGLAAGGEFAGAALFVAESAPADKRGRWASAPSRGGAFATSFAGLTFALTSLTMSDETFRAWGWRIPFLFSVVLLVVGLYIRLKMEETPVFTREANRKGTASIPLFEAIRKQWREILLGCMVEVPAFALLYLNVTYVVNFGSNELKLGYTSVLAVTVASGFLMLLGIIIASNLSDRIGRRPVLIAANSIAAVWALALFPVLHIGTLAAYATCVVISMFTCGLIFGPVGSFMSELFQTRYRYTAVGFCYNTAGILGGALPPLFAARIIAAYGNLAFGAVLATLCVASVICCATLKETRYKALDE